jgi:hypothetical protein
LFFSNGVGSGAAEQLRFVAEARASGSWQASGMYYFILFLQFLIFNSDY